MKRRFRRVEDRGDGQWAVNCSCGVTFDDGEKMASCDECGVRVHARCYRFVRSEASFLCLKCAASASGFGHDTEVTEFADILIELSTKTQRYPLPSKRRKDIESGEGKQVIWKENAKCHSDKAVTNINNKAGSVFDSRKDVAGEDRAFRIAESALPGTSQVEKEKCKREKLGPIQSAANAEEGSQREGAAAPSIDTRVLGSSSNDAAEHPVGESMNRSEREVCGEQMIPRVHLFLDEGTQTLCEVIVEKDASSKTKEEISLLKQRMTMLEAQFAKLQARTKEEEEMKGLVNTSLYANGKLEVNESKLHKFSEELQRNVNKKMMADDAEKRLAKSEEGLVNTSLYANGKLEVNESKLHKFSEERQRNVNKKKMADDAEKWLAKSEERLIMADDAEKWLAKSEERLITPPATITNIPKRDLGLGRHSRGLEAAEVVRSKVDRDYLSELSAEDSICLGANCVAGLQSYILNTGHRWLQSLDAAREAEERADKINAECSTLCKLADSENKKLKKEKRKKEEEAVKQVEEVKILMTRIKSLEESNDNYLRTLAEAQTRIMTLKAELKQRVEPGQGSSTTPQPTEAELFEKFKTTTLYEKEMYDMGSAGFELAVEFLREKQMLPLEQLDSLDYEGVVDFFLES